MRLLMLLFILLFTTVSYSKTKVEIFKESRKSVVLIKTIEKPNFFYKVPGSQGTGYIVDKNGLIVTNYHVIEEAEGIVVFVNDGNRIDTLAAYPVEIDEDLDIAVLKVDSKNLTALEFEDENNIQQAEEMLVFGYPGASAKSDNITITWGIVSGNTTDSTLQTTATINRGNSGGPGINFDGKVIGTVFSKAVGFSVEATGFMRNNKYVKEVIEFAKADTIGFEDYSYFENYQAYQNFCMAEAKAWIINENLKDETEDVSYRNEELEVEEESEEAKEEYEEDVESDDDEEEIRKAYELKIQGLKEAKTYMNKTIELADDFYWGYIYLASYSMRAGDIYCDEYEQYDADQFAEELWDELTVADRKFPKSKLKQIDEYWEIAEEFSEEKKMYCRFWRDFNKYKKKIVENRQERIDEFYDYLNFGKTPKRLIEALLYEKNGDSDFDYIGNFGIPVIFSFMPQLDDYSGEYEIRNILINSKWKFTRGVSSDFGLNVYTNPHTQQTNINLRLGLSLGGFIIAYNIGELNPVVPKYELGLRLMKSYNSEFTLKYSIYTSLGMNSVYYSRSEESFNGYGINYDYRVTGRLKAFTVLEYVSVPNSDKGFKDPYLRIGWGFGFNF